VVAIDGDFLKHGGKAEDMGLFLLSHDLFPIGKSHARACAVGRSYISNRKRFSFANAMLTKEKKQDDVALLSVRVARLMLGCGGGGDYSEFIR
jgi:hypothetical protein